jgi:hypothetical protein
LFELHSGVHAAEPTTQNQYSWFPVRHTSSDKKRSVWKAIRQETKGST